MCISLAVPQPYFQRLQVRAAAPSRLCVDVSFHFASLVTRALSEGRPVYPRHGEALLGEGNAGCAGPPGGGEASWCVGYTEATPGTPLPLCPDMEPGPGGRSACRALPSALDGAGE